MSLDRKNSREIGKAFASDQGFTRGDQGSRRGSRLSPGIKAFPGVQAVSLRQPVETDGKKRMISACLGEELGHNARRDRDHASRFTIPTSPGPIWLANRAGSVFHGSFKRR
jgi:hypothetical protein